MVAMCPQILYIINEFDRHLIQLKMEYTAQEWAHFFRGKGYTEAAVEEYLLQHKPTQSVDGIYGYDEDYIYLLDFEDWEPSFLQEIFKDMVEAYHADCDVFDFLESLRRGRGINWVDVQLAIDLQHVARYFFTWLQLDVSFGIETSYTEQEGYQIQLTLQGERCLGQHPVFAIALAQAMNQISINAWDALADRLFDLSISKHDLT